MQVKSSAHQPAQRSLGHFDAARVEHLGQQLAVDHRIGRYIDRTACVRHGRHCERATYVVRMHALKAQALGTWNDQQMVSLEHDARHERPDEQPLDLRSRAALEH